MGTSKIKITGDLINPTIIDADTNEPITCCSAIEFMLEAQNNPYVKLTIPFECLDISEWGKSWLEREYGQEKLINALKIAKEHDKQNG
jgi:hypothetical protein